LRSQLSGLPGGSAWAVLLSDQWGSAEPVDRRRPPQRDQRRVTRPRWPRSLAWRRGAAVSRSNLRKHELHLTTETTKVTKAFQPNGALRPAAPAAPPTEVLS
jgi:hypothetical protein